MVFQHVRNLPVILGQLEPWIDQINGIGVSVFPRRRADSYMPAFLVGKGMAESLSYVLRVPVSNSVIRKSCIGSHSKYA